MNKAQADNIGAARRTWEAHIRACKTCAANARDSGPTLHLCPTGNQVLEQYVNALQTGGASA